jgi:aspartyl-tRNA(Asn)/glutamyl-tRNA(Gln) amidotransferase subunit B
MSGPEFVPTIGLEVHCQLATRTKLFSACPTRFGAPANTLVDAYTLALPGALPVVNEHAVELAIRLALAVGAELQPISRWARKHYAYPDLPKGYQITQADAPLARGGSITVDGRALALTRIHLEEDAGKLQHVGDVSLLDLNRAGAPLVEIVGAPVITSAAEAAAYLRELRAIVRALGVSSADMEEGSLRCDANVSICPRGQALPGTRCEIKNLNSFRFLESAITAEIRRQTQLLRAGEGVAAVTLGYDADRDRLYVMRAKESAAEYHYMPEADLPPLCIDAAWIERVRAALPDLPAARRCRYVRAGLTAGEAARLVDEPALGDYFDAAREAVPAGEGRPLYHWLCGDLLGLLHAHGQAIADSPVRPAQLAALVGLVAEGTLTGPAAKAVLARCHAEGRDPAEVVAQGGYTRVDDEAALAATIAAVLAANPRQLAQYRGGKPALRAYFVGLILRETRGQADPRRVQELLDRALAAPADAPT